MRRALALLAVLLLALAGAAQPGGDSGGDSRGEPAAGPSARSAADVPQEPDAPYVLPAVVTEADRPYAGADGEGDAPAAWRVWLGRMHPLVVHFPIALLLSALLAELLSLLRRAPLLDHAARFCVLVGALSAVVAAFSGHTAADTAGVDRAFAALLERHELLGNVTAGLAIPAAIASEWSRRAAATARSLRAHRLILLALAVLVGVTGHYGGTLVFGPGHFG